MDDLALFVSRLFLGIPFIIWGVMKLRGGGAELVPALVALGLPNAVLFANLIGLCELVGGIAVVIGYPARTASVLLGIWCLITGYQAHRGNVNELLLHIAMAGGFFLLATAGSGSIALFGGTPPGLFADVE